MEGSTIGGNIFKKDHKVLRLSKKEYLSYCKEISDILEKLCVSPFKIVDAYKNKDSFGDMDIVLTKDESSFKAIKDFVKENNYPSNLNGDVFSFLFKNFQIDLIRVPKESFKYSCNYFAWNDLGNIIGRMAKSLGFKHGHNGLFYVQRYGDVVLKEHLLSLNYLDILKILKLDYGVFRCGFVDLKDIFIFATNSPYFHKDKFKLENLNNTNRVRDRKRQTYNLFLKFIEQFPDSNLTLSATEKLSFVIKLFPNLKNDIEECENNYLNILKIKKITNATLIMEITGLKSGKELGNFITYFHNNNKVYSTITALSKTSEEVVEDVKKTFEAWSKL